jgi:hypothetical protein
MLFLLSAPPVLLLHFEQCLPDVAQFVVFESIQLINLGRLVIALLQRQEQIVIMKDYS